MCTCLPSNRYSPSSIVLMPAMVLIRVDLPAPLSPTRAVTRPVSAEKSTAVSAWTAPKRLLTPRSSRVGVLEATGVSFEVAPAPVGAGATGRLWMAGLPRRQEMPAEEQAEAAGPLQISLALRKPSLMIV